MTGQLYLPSFLLVVVGIAVLAAAALAPPRAGAQEPAPSITVTQADPAAYPDVSAVVTVLDAQGVPVTNLASDAFGVVGADAEVTSVTSAQDETLGLAVAFVIDTSGSMEGAPLAAAKAAATQFVNQLGPNDRVALFAFSGTVNEVVPLTGDRAALSAAIDGLVANGPTSLYDAVQASVLAASGFDAPRRAVVFLSDGENDTTTGTATDTGSLDAAQRALIPVFAIGYGAQSDTGYLQNLATGTRGSFYRADSADVGAVYSAIGGMLRNQYIVGLRDSAPPDGNQAAIQLTAVVDGQVVTSAPIQYARGDVASAPTEAPVTATAPQPAPAAAEGDGDGSSSTMLLSVVAAVVIVGAVAGGLLFVVRRLATARAQAKRERLAGRGSDESVPAQAESVTNVAPVAKQHARIVATAGALAGQTFEIAGDMPLVFGTDPSVAVRLDGADVAPRHASVWVSGGRITLRNIATGRHKTLVDGQSVDVIILDGGDEFAIGAHRFQTELLAPGA